MSRFINYTFHFFNYLIFTVFGLLCIYPFFYIFVYSISDPILVQQKSLLLFPVGFNLKNYLIVFKLEGIARAFMVSASRAVLGTAVTIFFSAMFGYVLTKRELFLKKFMYRAVVVSMYLNAGLIPWYMTMKYLGLKNSFLLYILPTAIQPFLLILIKTYVEQIPQSLEESAIIDGAGYFTIFTRVILPVSIPIIAAVGVFSAVGQWNTWQDNFFLVNNSKLNTLQLTLLRFLNQAEAIAKSAMSNNSDINQMKNFSMTPMSVRMTITMVVTIPIMLVYPFLQRYFVKGIMLGSVKG